MVNYYTPEEQYWMTGGNTGELPVRITPSKINILGENEIFVFGSNIKESLTHFLQWKELIVPKKQLGILHNAQRNIRN